MTVKSATLLVTLLAQDPEAVDEEQLAKWEERNILVVSRQPFLNVFVVDEEEWEAEKRARRDARKARRVERRARIRARARARARSASR